MEMSSVSRCEGSSSESPPLVYASLGTPLEHDDDDDDDDGDDDDDDDDDVELDNTSEQTN
ncbi:hypothetical protein EYF80_030382 [Liparis tanakae]|uniref:Uncharacterized protein n=1 Tax=Liparis tanakae TaxID=230148 RepID=A0A4Z2H0I3_9TELE|nr:hypothetical protein EYF80_030382 [Liparis tanakae]